MVSYRYTVFSTVTILSLCKFSRDIFLFNLDSCLFVTV